jgi:hypothetical protein
MPLSQEFKEKWLNKLFWFILILTGMFIVNEFTGIDKWLTRGLEKLGTKKEKIEKLIK